MGSTVPLLHYAGFSRRMKFGGFDLQTALICSSEAQILDLEPNISYPTDFVALWRELEEIFLYSVLSEFYFDHINQENGS